VRFLLLDRILEFERDKRLVATKTATLAERFLTEHYARRPIVPATLVIESLAQAGGWLNVISRDFRLKVVLAVVEGVRLGRPVRPGEPLLIEAVMLYAHVDGVTVRGEARVDSETVASVERMVFAHESVEDEAFARTQRERFQYVSGGLRLPLDPRP